MKFKISSYEPNGEIEGDKYLNEEEKLVIDGVEYRVFTDIYWEGRVSKTEEPVSDANKVIDVIVGAKDLFANKTKQYSILRTMVTGEGERNPRESG